MRVPRALAPLLAALVAAGCVLTPDPPGEEPPAADAGTPAGGTRPTPDEGAPSLDFPALEGTGGREGPDAPLPEDATTAPPEEETPTAPPATPPPATLVPTNPPSPTPASPPPPSGGGAPRPVRFEAGADAQPSRYVERFALGPAAISFAADVRGVPDARVHLSSLFVLRNDGDVPYTARLVTEGQGAPPGVQEALLTLRAPTGETATLDLRVPGATLDLSLPPRSVREGSWTYTLGPDAPASFSWGMRMVAEG